MKITYSDLLDILGDGAMDEYVSHIGQIKMTKNWNQLEDLYGIPLLSVAIFVILHTPKPKTDLDMDYLSALRRNVSNLKKRVYTYKLKNGNIDFFTVPINERVEFESDPDNCKPDQTMYELALSGQLGKYAKYFLVENITPENVRSVRNKNLIARGTPVTNVLFNVPDEAAVVLSFLQQIEETKDDLQKLYEDFRNDNQNIKNSKIKPTDIDNDLKEVLSERLQKIGLTKARINRITSKVIKAIKQEILQPI